MIYLNNFNIYKIIYKCKTYFSKIYIKKVEHKEKENVADNNQDKIQ